MKQWCVVYTQPSKELAAQLHLKEQGFEVYLPRFKKMRRHARKVEEVLAPLFPRYLFINIDLDVCRWRSVNGTRGVSYLLTQDERPSIVPLGLIDGLQKQESSEGIVSLEPISPFSKGEKVLILEGAFEGQIATFEKLDDKQRVQVLLNLLGRDTKVLVPSYSVATA